MALRNLTHPKFWPELNSHLKTIATAIQQLGANGTLAEAGLPESAVVVTKRNQVANVEQFGCYVWRSAALSIANGTVTAIQFDTESYDRGNSHSVSTNTTRLTVPVGGAGRWHFIGQVAFTSNAVGLRLIRVKKNGATVIARRLVQAANGDDTVIGCEVYDPASADTDYYELEAYHTSGGNLALNVSDIGQTFFQGMKVVG